MQKKWGGSQKRECPSPYHYPPAPRHFERSKKSSLHNGQATSVRCRAAPRRFYHYLISTEYRYDIKDPSAPLGMTIREAGYLTWLFIRSRRRLPLRGSLSSAFSAPLLQGATPLTCKSATPKRHSLPDGKVNEIRIPLSPYRHFERSEKSCLHTGKRESVK